MVSKTEQVYSFWPIKRLYTPGLKEEKSMERVASIVLMEKSHVVSGKITK